MSQRRDSRSGRSSISGRSIRNAQLKIFGLDRFGITLKSYVSKSFSTGNPASLILVATALAARAASSCSVSEARTGRRFDWSRRHPAQVSRTRDPSLAVATAATGS